MILFLKPWETCLHTLDVSIFQLLNPILSLFFLKTKSFPTWIRDRARYTLDFHSVFIFRYCDDLEWTNCLLYGAFSSPVTVLWNDLEVLVLFKVWGLQTMAYQQKKIKGKLKISLNKAQSQVKFSLIWIYMESHLAEPQDGFSDVVGYRHSQRQQGL